MTASLIALSNNITMASTAPNNMLVEVLERGKLASASKVSPMKSAAFGKNITFLVRSWQG